MKESTEETYGAGGHTYAFNITPLANRLRDADAWDPDRLRVSFVPDIDDEEEGPEDGDLRVGRVSVLYA